jgi:hypothetical protein
VDQRERIERHRERDRRDKRDIDREIERERERMRNYCPFTSLVDLTPYT